MTSAQITASGGHRCPARESAGWALALLLCTAAVVGLGPRAGYLGAALGGGAVLLLVLLRPAWCIYLLLGVTMLLREYPIGTASPAGNTVYDLGLAAGGKVYLLDVLVVAALVGLLLRAAWRREPWRVAPESIPLLLLLALVPWMIMWGAAYGADLRDAAADYRIVIRAAVVYLLALTALHTRRSLLLAAGVLLGAGTLRVLFGAGKYLLGHGESYALAGVGRLPVPFFEQADAQIAALVGIAALAYLLWSPGRLRWGVGLLTMAVLIAAVLATGLSIRRAAWLTLAVGMAVVAVAAWRSRPARGRMAVLLAVLGIAALAGGSRLFAYAHWGQVALRAVSLVEVTAGTSEALHYGEILDAWDNVRRRPLLGGGFGHLLERRHTRLLAEQGHARGRLMRVHNVYLDLWVKGGLPALLLFLWWIAASLRRFARGAAQLRGSPLGWIYLGLLGAWVGWLAASLGTTMILGGNRPALMFFGVAALLSGLYYSEAHATQPAEAPPPGGGEG